VTIFAAFATAAFAAAACGGRIEAEPGASTKTITTLDAPEV
jgi:hypothetical protein